MRVAFGTTVLARGLAQGGVDGIGSYTRELLQRMAASPQLSIQPFAYTGPAPPGMASGMVNGGDFQRQALLSLATGLPFSRLQKALANKVDVLHATDHYIPRLRGIPVIATLMDAIPLAHPEWVTYRFNRAKNEAWRRSAQWAQHILTISEHSRSEIAQWFRIPEKRISVVPLGVDERWFATPSSEELAHVRQHYQLPERFFLAVGTLQPRKNIGTLIAAHRLLAPQLRQDIPLVVVGKAGWGCEDVVAQLAHGDGGALRWLRYVPDADMLPLLHQASALVFPSLHEGFGLPVLEAFAARTPVISANTTALAEIAPGGGALMVNPHSSGELAEAMRYMAQASSPQVQQLQNQGVTWAQKFTWQATQQGTLAAYQQLLSS